MLPFSFDDDFFRLVQSPSSLWEVSNLRIDKSAFYPHIYKFLVENTECKNTQNINNCTVFSLKDTLDHIPCAEDKSIAKLFSKTDLETEVKTNDSDKRKVSFRLLNEKSKLFSPKLLVYPLANIGILMISVELTGKQSTLNDLMDLNYKLQRINTSQSPINIVLPENAHAERVKGAEKVYKSLVKYEFKEHKIKKDEDCKNWYLHNLLAFLLFDSEKNKVTVDPFNGSSLHVFTYLQINSQEHSGSENQQDKDELKKDFIRIARCQNRNYKILPKDMENNAVFMQTFENIYIASCVEGACMMVDSPDNNSEFINDFKNASFVSRYLWIYLLVYLQRYTLIQLTKKLLDIDMNAAVDSKEDLGDLVKKLAKIKISSHFADISDHTQHNIFYKFYSGKLFVKDQLDVVRDKIGDVDLILRSLIEEEEKKRSRRLEWILKALMMPGLFFSVVAFYSLAHLTVIRWIPITFVVLMIILLWLVFSDAFKDSKRRKKRELEKLKKKLHK